MIPDFRDVRFLVGEREGIGAVCDTPVLPLYDKGVISFLSDLSKEIIGDRALKVYPDVIALGYWLRKASLLREQRFIANCESKIGRGVSFHIAPSNMPMQFVISMVPALLAGNICVIRVSAKRFEKTEILCEKIRKVLFEKHQELQQYLYILQYDYNDEITGWLSSICDVRVIWGGDSTIQKIRQYPVSPRTVELTFSDRYSIAVINTDAIEEDGGDLTPVIDSFWLDTYFVDQSACSSPRLIAWVGRNQEAVRQNFWTLMDKKVAAEYSMEPVRMIDKLSNLTRMVMLENNAKLHFDNAGVVRAEVTALDPKIMDYKCGSGCFFEYSCGTLDDIAPLVKDKRCQTVALYGIEPKAIKEMVYRYGARGVDRIVSIGKTNAPELRWDGYTLVESMSRYIEVEGE